MYNIEPIVFDQRDKRWRSRMYSNHKDVKQTIGTSGSALALCASIIATLYDRSVDPWVLAQLSMKWGCRRYCHGTSWDFFRKVAEHYGVRKFVQSNRFEALKECLDAGGYAICSMKAGYWTKVGNYILAWLYNDKNVYAIGSERKRGSQGIDSFQKDSNMYFCFYPDTEDKEES